MVQPHQTGRTTPGLPWSHSSASRSHFAAIAAHVPEHVFIHAVDADRHTVQSRICERLRDRSKQDAVGGKRQIHDTRQLTEPGKQFMHLLVE